MFRGQFVANGDAFVHRCAQYREGLTQCFLCRGCIWFWQSIHLTFHLGIHRIDEGGAGTDEDGTRHNVVFGLSNQIGCYDRRISSVIGDDKHLRRTGKHVNATVSIHNGFCSSNPLVARSNNDVTWRHCGNDLLSIPIHMSINAISHGANGLCSPHTEDDVGTSDVGCSEGDGCRFGRGEDDVRAPSRTGGDGGHDDGGWEGISSSGGVASSSLARTNRLPSLPPRNIHLHIHHTLPLRFGKCLHSAMNIQQRCPFLLRERIEGSLAPIGCHDVGVAVGCIFGNVTETMGHREECRGRA
mmetsp:Transcript_11377/g.14527  ORF Transcript_11377/g.14527 Transcript_11377/m.14527 type:complete len:299 (+) Transcript_11377:722-1618(+)